ncbi:MAG: gamma-glutamyltransferase [Gemmatimonadota bacterium]|nr:gamma-glutamyltransferase [Gemmatimonadota bacterium]
MAFSSEGTVHRSTVTGARGMVASGHPLASLAGVRMLLERGNAFDAAVAVAAALNVVEPYMSGIAGVGYALVYSAAEDRVRVLDYCGRTPHDATSAFFPTPQHQDGGVTSCLVPGACGGWLELLDKYGTMDRATVFAPAIELAENGFPVTVKNSRFIRDAVPRMRPTGTRVILSPGRAPRAGDVLIQKDLARTFRRVVEGGVEAFYRGDLASEIAGYAQAGGGLLSRRDLADFEVEWADPISTFYREFRVICPPLPSAGFHILQALNMLEGYQLEDLGHHSEESLHLFIEVLKLGNADRVAFAAAREAPLDGLLSKGYANERRSLIGDRAAVNRGEYFAAVGLPGEISPGQPGDWLNECTTHFDVVDAEGNAVAITQSLGSGFGSGEIIGETGMFLNNFIKWADTVPGSPNRIEPHKKIDMCLSPCQIFKDGRLLAALGTPGSWGIQQTTTQFTTNFLDYGMNIQAAIEAPRFRFQHAGTRVYMESRVPAEIRSGLNRRGHQIDVVDAFSPVTGGAQGIAVDQESGGLMGGADPRRDGYAIGI